MRLFTVNFVVSSLLLAANAIPVAAQEATAKPAGFKEMYLFQLKDTESKFVRLAEAMPQEKYGWRPGEGVRSVSEVYMHVAGSNYYFLSLVGVKASSGLPRDAEKSVTDKDKVIAAIKASFEAASNAVTAMSDADFEKETKFGGRPATNLAVLFFMTSHMHEHLGQSIAYARTNGVVPPWSQKKEN